MPCRSYEDNQGGRGSPITIVWRGRSAPPQTRMTSTSRRSMEPRRRMCGTPTNRNAGCPFAFAAVVGERPLRQVGVLLHERGRTGRPILGRGAEVPLLPRGRQPHHGVVRGQTRALGVDHGHRAAALGPAEAEAALGIADQGRMHRAQVQHVVPQAIQPRHPTLQEHFPFTVFARVPSVHVGIEVSQAVERVEHVPAQVHAQGVVEMRHGDTGSSGQPRVSSASAARRKDRVPERVGVPMRSRSRLAMVPQASKQPVRNARTVPRFRSSEVSVIAFGSTALISGLRRVPGSGFCPGTMPHHDVRNGRFHVHRGLAVEASRAAAPQPKQTKSSRRRPRQGRTVRQRRTDL